ncbi:MAG: AAA family ATPase [Desulfobacterales bacterium]
MKKYVNEFSRPEKTDYYSEKNYKEAKRKYIMLCLKGKLETEEAEESTPWMFLNQHRTNYNSCNPRDLSFETTDNLEVLNHFIGQLRAMKALHFGVGIRQEGYNIFALGESGTGKYTLIRRFFG